MKNPKNMMGVLTLIYLIVVGLGLFVATKVIPAAKLLDAMLPLAFILLLLWFVLIFAVLKWQGNKRK